MVLASGGVGASVLYSLKEIPGKVMSFGKRKLITSVSVSSHDGKLYPYLNQWLDLHPYTKNARLLSASQKEISTPIIFSPAPGDHVLTYKGHYIWATKERQNLTTGQSKRLLESITLKTVTGTLQTFRDLLNEVRELQERDPSKVMQIYINRPDYWDTIGTKKNPRTFESLILPAGVKENLIKDLEQFKTSKQEYTKLGIPYRRGYMLSGSPGGGKSSCAEAIAAYLCRDVYILRLSAKNLDDSDLLSLIASTSSNSVLLLEDCDCMFSNREAEESSKITFSGLLNALDGTSSKEGLVTILSTNHIENIDPALMRPGRVDKHLRLENATKEQAEELYLRFFPGSSNAAQFSSLFIGESMAAVQGALIQHKDNEEELLQTLKKEIE